MVPYMEPFGPSQSRHMRFATSENTLAKHIGKTDWQDGLEQNYVSTFLDKRVSDLEF